MGPSAVYETVSAPEEEYPPRSLTLDRLLLLARNLLAERQGYGWKELYCRALLNSLDGDEFITLAATSAEDEGKLSSGTIIGQRQGFTTNAKLTAPNVLRVLDLATSVILIGPAGSGKTTVLRNIAARFSLTWTDDAIPDRFPVYVRLKFFSEENCSLAQAAARSIREMLHGHLSVAALSECREVWSTSKSSGELSQEQMLNVLEHTACVSLERSSTETPIILFLDGYNEVPRHLRHFLDQDIQRCVTGTNPVILTSRLSLPPGLSKHFRSFVIDELDANLAGSYLDAKLPENTRHVARKWWTVPAISRVLRLPFYLTRAAQFASSKNDTCPTSRARLVEQFVHDAILRKQVEGIFTAEQQVDALLEFLRVHAWQMIRNNSHFDVQPISLSLDDTTRQTSGEASTFANLAEQLGLLEPCAKPHYNAAASRAFTHEIYRDFFVALHLLSFGIPVILQLLPALAEDYERDGIVEMLVGLVSDPAHALQILNRLGALEHQLASRCLIECSNLIPDSVPAALASLIKDSRCIGGTDSCPINAGPVINGLLFAASSEQLIQMPHTTPPCELGGSWKSPHLADRLGSSAFPILRKWYNEESDGSEKLSIANVMAGLPVPSGWSFLLGEVDRHPFVRSVYAKWIMVQIAKQPLDLVINLARVSKHRKGVLDALPWSTLQTLTTHSDRMIRRVAANLCASQFARAVEKPDQLRWQAKWLLREPQGPVLLLDKLVARQRSGDDKAEALLLELLRQAVSIPCDSHFSPCNLRFVIDSLSTTGSQDTVLELVRLACLGYGALPPYLLVKVLRDHVLSRIRDMLKGLRRERTTEWIEHRTTVGLGLLGDLDVSRDLEQLLLQLPTVLWDNPRRCARTRLHIHDIQASYARLVYRALVATSAFSTFPILEAHATVSKSEPLAPIYADAKRAMFMLQYSNKAPLTEVLGALARALTDEYIRKLFFSHNSSDREYWPYWLDASMAHEIALRAPDEISTCVDLISRAINANKRIDNASLKFAARFITSLRDETTHRFLDKLAGFPIKLRFDSYTR
ncbi:MAG: NACHT domain-containing protein [Planctomycetes bacterium]|nr:NACHT domain-containing protein [Planctomycetota bacterium]